MKITIEREDGQSQVLEGNEANNFMFMSTVGITVFNMPIVMSLCGHPNFSEHAAHMVKDMSFSQMFLRAVRTDEAADWNKLLNEHYGGEAGFQALKQQTLDEIRKNPDAARDLGLSESNGEVACVEI